MNYYIIIWSDQTLHTVNWTKGELCSRLHRGEELTPHSEPLGYNMLDSVWTLLLYRTRAW
jgi:hypothetical protein